MRQPAPIRLFCRLQWRHFAKLSLTIPQPEEVQYRPMPGEMLRSVKAQEWPETSRDQGAETLLDTLHCLRVAVTIFDSETRLVFATTHLNYIFRKLPPAQSLLGMP
jgi:hypothetical protein